MNHNESFPVSYSGKRFIDVPMSKEKNMIHNTLFGILPFILVLITFAKVNASTTQWASNVIEVTSERQQGEFGAQQMLGRPNSMPYGIESKYAWMPAGYYNVRQRRFEESSMTQVIQLGYRNAMQVSQIAIAESFNPGAIKVVLLIDEDGNEQKVWQSEPQKLGKNGRMLNIFIPLTSYKAKSIKLVLDVAAVAGWNQIDAVGISDSQDSLKAEVNIVKNLPKGLKRENLGKMINTQYTDYVPIISPDGKTLYFSRNGDPQNVGGQYSSQDIWYSILEKGQWSEAKNIGSPLNTPSSNAVLSVTPDGNTLLLNNKYAKNGYPSGMGYSLSYKTKDGWSFPEDVKIRGFYNNNIYAEACLSGDAKIIIMAVERNETMGGRDLYISKLLPDNTWSTPLNMGPDINTSGDETTPFLAADGKTLYYSTDGFAGFGNKDVYVTRRLDDTWMKWSEPENLGSEINTVGFDAYFTIPASGEYAYCVSSENTLGREDIFRIKLPTSARPVPVVLISGKVLDEKTKKPVEAKIFYEVLPSGEEVGIARTNPTDGSYKISLPAGSVYGFRAEAKGFYPISDNLDTRKLTEYTELSKDLFLAPITIGQAIRLNNIFFETGKSELREESFPELKRAAVFMNTNPTYEIEVSGHTDNVGKSEDNQKLSELRAQSVFDYLISLGVQQKRLSKKGYGPSKPVTSNATESGKQKNRRVEFIIKKQ